MHRDGRVRAAGVRVAERVQRAAPRRSPVLRHRAAAAAAAAVAAQDRADRARQRQRARLLHVESGRRQRAAGGERFEFVGRLLGLGCVGLEQHGGRQQFDGVGQRLDGARRGQQRRRPLERRRGRLGGFGAAGGERRGRYARHRRGERESAECRIEPVHAIAEHGEQPAHADAAADPADRFDGARAIAATAGMASIPHMDRDSSFAMGGGTATFQGRKAMAVGVQARITENLKATVNVGFAGSQRVVGAGMLYQWK
nr:YadA C-terminal domain-containing protein [Burkholderia vietnamiensis]